jgi:hypothetical protein
MRNYVKARETREGKFITVGRWRRERHTIGGWDGFTHKSQLGGCGVPLTIQHTPAYATGLGGNVVRGGLKLNRRLDGTASTFITTLAEESLVSRPHRNLFEIE